MHCNNSMRFPVLFSVVVLLAETNAQTDLSATWETMKYGLFVHYVFGGEYGGMTPLSTAGGYPNNIDECVDAFNVGTFAADVKDMGFEYVVFTLWHANMGVLYPSKVMADYKFDQHDHYTSKRDLLGEVMDSLAVRGIKFSIYTHIWVGHDFHPNDGKSYYSYSNKNGIKTQDMINSGYVESVEGKPQKWNDFICKVYDEISTRYGEKVTAYWFDGTWTGVVDKKRIMETIRKTNKTCAFVANGNASHGMPYSCKEVGGAGPEKDMQMDYPDPKVISQNVNTWPAYERSVAIVQSANWWASPNGKARYSAEVLYKYTVLEAAANTGGGGVTWALSPFVDGSWEKDVLESGKKVRSYISPIAESIKNTRPGKSYKTAEGTKISQLSNGFVATTSANGAYEYIHVLTPPAATSLQLPSPADGKKFYSAMLLHNKKKVTLAANSAGYLLTLPKDEQWDSMNTVIRLSKDSALASIPEIWKTSTGFTLSQAGNRLRITVPDRMAGTLSIYTINGKVIAVYNTDGRRNSFQTKKAGPGYYVVNYKGTCDFSCGYMMNGF